VPTIVAMSEFKVRKRTERGKAAVT
jgi:hypothetical protein